MPQLTVGLEAASEAGLFHCSSHRLMSARGAAHEFGRVVVVIATGVGDAVGLVVFVMGTMAGTMNSMGWVAALIYLFGRRGMATS